MGVPKEQASHDRVMAALRDFDGECDLSKRYVKRSEADGVMLERYHPISRITSPRDGMFCCGKSDAMTKEQLFAFLQAEMKKNADP